MSYLLHKKTMLVAIACGVLLLGMVGCTYKHGDEAIRHTSQEDLKRALVVGETTKDMVLANYGTPSSTGMESNGNEVWNYNYGEAKQSGLAYVPIIGIFAPPPKSTGKTISITFGSNGKVLSYSMGGATGQAGTWE